MKKILLAAIVFCMLVCGFACAELAAPQNPVWKEGSTATATWDAVDGADYYELNVSVYDETGTVLLGSATTGTSTTEADVQLQANIVINEQETEYTAVKLAYTVKAGVTGSDGSIVYGTESVLSPMWDYTFALIQLQPPENIVLNEDGTASWNSVAEAYSYHINVEAYTDAELQNNIGASGAYVYEGDAFVENGIVSYYYDQLCEAEYRHALSIGYIGNGDALWMRAQVKCIAESNSPYVDSVFSEYSDAIEYVSTELIKLSPPETLLLNQDGIATWNDIEGTFRYYVDIMGFIDADCTQYASSSVKQVYTAEANIENGFVSCDLSDAFEEVYKAALTNQKIKKGDVLWLQFDVFCETNNDNQYVNSVVSEKSNAIEYVSTELIPLNTPQNVVLDHSYTASWPNAEGADHYYVYAYGYTGSAYNNYVCTVSRWIYSNEYTENNGSIVCDLSALFEDTYKSAMANNSIVNGDNLGIRIQVKACASEDSVYVDSPFSDYSNTIVYTPRIPVESFTLSPAEPVVYVGNSYHLGITITPEDAYYSSVDWSTTDAATVTVDSTGLITGVAAGEAEITADIGDADCTVPVMVYDISSNIEDNEDQEEVKDTAGDIIDDLVNKDNPDLGNTDITEDEREEIRDEVQDGIWRGDEFFTDMNWYDREFGAYKNNWGQIQKAARLLNAQFAGAYNIEVEMYHKEKDGSTIHPIGCIEEFENDISFAFDLPTGMDEIRDGYARKYVLVRIHRNEIDTVDFEHADGKGKGKSKHFSDFVLLYVDTPTEPVDLTGLSTLTLPASVVSVEAEAFAGTAAEVVVIPEGCRSIGSRAFADCPNLRYIVVPTDWDIDPANDAFDGCTAEILYR